MKTAVIVDVDGTLCDVSGVRHYVLDDREHPDYRAFHAASALCPPILSTLEWVDEQRALGHAIIVVTARSTKWWYLTKRWMAKWGVFPDVFLMREEGDQRKDRLVKADILETLRADGWDIVAAIDDNPNVIALWREAGIPVTVVPGWDYGRGQSVVQS